MNFLSPVQLFTGAGTSFVSSVSQLIGFYRIAQGGTPTSIDNTQYYKIATLKPVAAYGTLGAWVEFDVQCGQHPSNAKTRYVLQIGDRDSTQSFRYYLTAEGTSREVNQGLAVYSETVAGQTYLQYHVYAFTITGFYGSISVNARNVGYSKDQVSFFPNPVSEASPTPVVPGQTLTLVLSTATAALNWSSIGTTPAASTFTMAGSLTVANTLSLTSGVLNSSSGILFSNSQLRISSVDPRVTLIDTDAALNAKRHDLVIQSDSLIGRFYNDAGSSPVGGDWLRVTHVPNSHLAQDITFTASGSMISAAPFWVANASGSAALSVNAFTGFNAYLDFVRNDALASATRWRLRMDSGSEPVTGAGRNQSNLSLLCYDDSAANPITALTVSRANGLLDFKIAPTVNGQTIWNGGNLAVSGTVGRHSKFTANSTTLGDSLFWESGTRVFSDGDFWMGKPSGSASLTISAFTNFTARIDLVRNDGTSSGTRWRLTMAASPDPVTGSGRTGSDLSLICYNDSEGGPITAVSVSRANGAFNFTEVPTVASQAVWYPGNMALSPTSGYVARWTGASALGIGIIQDNNVGVGIGAVPATNTLLRINRAFANTGTSVGLAVETTRSGDDVVGQHFAIATTSSLTHATTLNQHYDFLANSTFSGAGTTTTVFGYRSNIIVNAGAGTIATRYGFYATAATGAGLASLTTEIAFGVPDLSAGTGRYGLWSGVNGTGTRWNVYAYGNSPNFFLGNVGIGSGKTVPAEVLDVAGNIRLSGQVISTLATGTAPLSVTSTTVNPNLNADLFDGFHSTNFLDVSGVSQTKAGPLIIGGGLNGNLQIANGTPANPGYIAFNTPFNVEGSDSVLTRRGYIGWRQGTGLGPNYINIQAENGWSWNMVGALRINSQITSTIASPTPPFVVASTGMVASLNTQYLGDATGVARAGAYYLDRANHTGTDVGGGTAYTKVAYSTAGVVWGASATLLTIPLGVTLNANAAVVANPNPQLAGKMDASSCAIIAVTLSGTNALVYLRFLVGSGITSSAGDIMYITAWNP